MPWCFRRLSAVCCFLNNAATTQIYTLSLHDALPISPEKRNDAQAVAKLFVEQGALTKYQAAALYQGKGKSLVYGEYVVLEDRKSTRLNSSHSSISYAVFCLKKKKFPSDSGSRRHTSS